MELIKTIRAGSPTEIEGRFVFMRSGDTKFWLGVSRWVGIIDIPEIIEELQALAEAVRKEDRP